MRNGTLAAAAFFLVGAICCAAALAYLIPHGMAERSWASFDPVLVEAAQDSPDIDRALTAMAPGTVSPWSSTVEIQAFGAMERISVAQLRHRLDEVDPRFDPFLRELHGLFRADDANGGVYTAYFVPRHDTIWAQHRRIREHLGRIRFWLVGWDPYPRLALLAAALFIAIAVGSSVRRGTAYVVAAAAAMIMMSVGGGPGGFVRAQLLFAGWLVWFEHQRGWEREVLSYGRARAVGYGIERWRTVFIALTGGGVLLSIAFDQEGRWWYNALSAVLLSGTCALLSGLSLSVSAVRVRRNEHPLFSPVPIISGSVRTRSSNGAVPLLPFIAVMMVLVPPTYYSLQARFDLPTGVVVPSPQRAVELPPPSEQQRPLGLESYLAHRAYQQALPFARQFAVPQLMEEVQLRRFAWEPTSMNEWFETVLQFDEHWFENVLDMRGEGTVYDLWLREGPAQELVFESIKPLYWPSQMRRYAALAAILILPMLFLRVERRKSKHVLLVPDRERQGA